MDAAVVNQVMAAHIKPDVVVKEDAGRDRQGLRRVYWTRVKVPFRAKARWTEDSFQQDLIVFSRAGIDAHGQA